MGDMKKRKKLKTTLIGSSKVHVNDIGTPNLHANHLVGIVKFENTNIGRAVVYDQHLIDALYLENYLDEREHNACDKYLGLIVRGTHMSNPSFGERLNTGKYYMAPVPRSCILIRVQRHLRELCGSEKESRFWRLMATNTKRVDENDVEVMKECADALTSYFYISQESPVSLFQQALINPI